MVAKRGPVCAGERVQLTDRKGKMVTFQLEAGQVTQTDHGLLDHDTVIGLPEGAVVTTLSASQYELLRRDRTVHAGTIQSGTDYAATVQENQYETNELSKGNIAQHNHAVETDQRKPWKQTRRVGGWPYVLFRPRRVDYLLSMPRGAQIMYPKDIAQVLSMGDIGPGMKVLESGAGSGAMSISLLDAVGPQGSLTTVEINPDFAQIALANATVYYGCQPSWWDLQVGDFDQQAAVMPDDSYDRLVLDMLDPWNRLKQAYRVLRPGGVLTVYVTTTTQMSRLAEVLRAAQHWTEPDIIEIFERGWKADGLAVRPQHQMIGHTGFLLVTRAMATGYRPLHKRNHGSKDTHKDIDQHSLHLDTQIQPNSPAKPDSAELDGLLLRDVSERKLRKVMRDLDHQVQQVEAAKLRDRPIPSHKGGEQ